MHMQELDLLFSSNLNNQNKRVLSQFSLRKTKPRNKKEFSFSHAQKAQSLPGSLLSFEFK